MERTIVLRVLTRCSSLDQFVATFRRLSTDTSVFVPTRNQRDVGAQTAFSIRLVDGAIMLSGLGEIAERHETADNAFGKPGILIDIRRLTAESQQVFDRMRAPLEAAERVPELVPVAGTNKIAASMRDVAEMIRPTTQMAPLFAEERTPGSPIVVPANPLTAETGGSLDAFVDSAMCECDEDAGLAAAIAEDDAAGVPAVRTDDHATTRVASGGHAGLGVATTLGVAPLAPATFVSAPFVVDTPITRWPRSSRTDSDVAPPRFAESMPAILAETAPPLADGPDAERPERTAMVALDRTSGEPQPGPWAALRSRLARTVRGVRWWLRRRRSTQQIRA